MAVASRAVARDSENAGKGGVADLESARTAIDIFSARVRAGGDETALLRKVDGRWEQSSWNEWSHAAREVGAGLVELGIDRRDRVIILANTRAEWVECELGVLMVAAAAVPIYPSSTPAQCEYIINDCGARYVIVEDPHQLEKLYHPAVRDRLGRVEKVIYMGDVAALSKPDAAGRTAPTLEDVLPKDADRDWLMSLSELRELGAAWIEAHPGGIEDLSARIDPQQAFAIVYTSGTTGPPKGVVLTHSNLCFTARSFRNLLGIDPDDLQLLFLPLAHSFAKVMEWATVTTGSRMAFAESIDRLVDNMQEVRPTFMAAVPRVYEKAYVKIQSGLEEKRNRPIKGGLVSWALKKGRERAKRLQEGEAADGPGMAFADWLVFKKVRAVFGGRMKFLISGGAPLSRDIAEFFLGAGLLILEGYGLTETTAVTHVNLRHDFRLGTVGTPIPGMEVKIAEDGEVLMRGGNVMREYFGKPEATRRAISPDGWFHTGDIGEIDPDGKLRITDRKKDIIVTAGGKNVAPQNIENSLKALCPYISQVMVYGDKRKYLSALITLSEENALEWARQNGLGDRDVAELATEPAIEELVKECVDQLNASLPSHETIKKYKILPRDFDQESGEITPTLKVKRKFCTEKYQDILDGFYPTDDRSSL